MNDTVDDATVVDPHNDNSDVSLPLAVKAAVAIYIVSGFLSLCAAALQFLLHLHY